ncbi:hypothetical protein ACFRGK_20745, partial [Bacillus subtilis]
MKLNEKLYAFFSEHVEQMAEEWIETMEESDPNSLYALHNATVTEELKEQDREFYRHLNYMYVLPEKQFLEEFQEWVIELTNDQKHLDTPVQFVDKRGSEWSHSEPLFSFLWDLKLFNKKT